MHLRPHRSGSHAFSRRPAAFAALLLLGLSAPTYAAAPNPASFVRVQGDQLFEDGRPFRFVSFNIPNLHLVEDNMVFDHDNAWRWPDRFEITDALESVRQQGGTVVRTYVLAVVRTNDPPGLPRHVLGPGRFDEAGFRTLDQVLQTASQTGIRLILPFVDNWSWWGGIAEYAGFRGKAKESFWTDPQIIADFQETIRHVVTRTNTLTGIRYCDDPAILCWETGNELESPASWTRQIAAFVKRLDPNHPVMDGYHTTELREESLAMPEVDLVTTHHYPGGNRSYADLVRANWAKAKGRKPYVVGEFGFVDTAQIAATLDAVQETGTAGALIWSLRFRCREGGFYWHSEPAGGNKYKAYHWPGFPSGAAYDEAPLLLLLQQRAYAIRGLSVPPPAIPNPPNLLPIQDAAAISWQGSVGAAQYVVERAPQAAGPWETIASDVDETAVQHRPLFVDSQAGPGNWCYRVRAKNPAGLSAPSNIQGPVAVRFATFVDEMRDFTAIHERPGTWDAQTLDSRKAKEDAHRLAGHAGSALVYRLPGPIQSCTAYAFFPGNVADPRFFISADGSHYSEIPVRKALSQSSAGDYGYWTPARFHSPTIPRQGSFLKVELTGQTQIGRLEISHSTRP